MRKGWQWHSGVVGGYKGMAVAGGGGVGQERSGGRMLRLAVLVLNSAIMAMTTTICCDGGAWLEETEKLWSIGVRLSG